MKDILKYSLIIVCSIKAHAISASYARSYSLDLQKLQAETEADNKERSKAIFNIRKKKNDLNSEKNRTWNDKKFKAMSESQRSDYIMRMNEMIDDLVYQESRLAFESEIFSHLHNENITKIIQIVESAIAGKKDSLKGMERQRYGMTPIQRDKSKILQQEELDKLKTYEEVLKILKAKGK